MIKCQDIIKTYFTGETPLTVLKNVFFDNKDTSEFSNDELAEIRSSKIGFVFQSFNLLSRASVLRNVELPLVYDNQTPKEMRRQKVESALVAAGLDQDRWHHLSNQLSGGQMQRVAI